MRDEEADKTGSIWDTDGDIMAGERRLSRADNSLPDWEMPDGAYRPVPIVWFAGAFLLQLAALTCLFFALIAVHPYVTIVCAALTTGWLGKWTWERGMARAAGCWKAATIAVLAVQLGLVCIGAFMRLEFALSA